MPELLLHYIWQMKAFLAFPQETTTGQRIEVIDVGTHNTDAGPDFSQAQGGAQGSSDKKDDVTDVDFEEVK